MIGHGTPTPQRREQPVDRLLEYRRAIADLRRLADRCVDHWVEGNDPAEKFPARRWGVGGFAPGHRECIAEATGDAGRQIREQRGQPPASAAKVGAGENDARGGDADANLAGSGHSQQKGVVGIHATDCAEQVAGDDRHRVAGQHRRIGREVAQQHRYERARRAPHCQRAQKGNAVLRKASNQHHAHHCADEGADHPEPALAQRSAELRQADNRRRRARPKRVVELQPERDVKSQRHRRPESQSEQQRRTGRPQRRFKSAHRKGCLRRQEDAPI